MRPRRRLLARLKALAALSVTLVVLGEVPGAWGGIIMTTAGGMTVGDGGPATHAVLNFPYSVAVDAAGNLFIADAANNRIRRVAASTGIITTFAGTGGTGFFGDGGPATSAQLWNPTGVAVDAAGEPPRERKSEPGTGTLHFGLRPAAHARLEDALVFVGSDAPAVVFDRVDDVRVFARDRDADVARAVAAGVLEDRLQDSFGEVAVEADAQPRGRFGDLEIEPPL